MLTLTTTQKAVLTGGLLGDLHIQKNTKANTCRLRFCHGVNQKEYCDWKYEIFKIPFCETTQAPFIEERTNGNNYSFYTGYKNEFLQVHSLWYPVIDKRFVKTVPLDIKKILTDPLALAVWYLDDGTKRSDTESCRIAT